MIYPSKMFVSFLGYNSFRFVNDFCFLVSTCVFPLIPQV